MLSAFVEAARDAFIQGERHFIHWRIKILKTETYPPRVDAYRYTKSAFHVMSQVLCEGNKEDLNYYLLKLTLWREVLLDDWHLKLHSQS